MGLLLQYSTDLEKLKSGYLGYMVTYISYKTRNSYGWSFQYFNAKAIQTKGFIFGIDHICLKTKSSPTGGIVNLVSLFILLSTKLEIIFTDVGGKLDFLTGVYLSAIVAKYLFNVSATISGSETKLLFI